MKEFLQAIEQNEELKAKLEALDQNPEATVDDFIALAGEYGFTLTAEDFAPVEATASTAISDDELDAVAGGKKCKCFGAGGGSGGTQDIPCACVGGGGGEYYISDGSKLCRCFCVAYGTGGTLD